MHETSNPADFEYRDFTMRSASGCLVKAGEMDRRALESRNETIRVEFLNLAAIWHRVARMAALQDEERVSSG